MDSKNTSCFQERLRGWLNSFHETAWDWGQKRLSQLYSLLKQLRNGGETWIQKSAEIRIYSTIKFQLEVLKGRCPGEMEAPD